MDSDAGKCLCCTCCCVVCISLIVLAFMSFSSLESNTYALKYNYITQSLSEEVYTSGMYFTGPGYEFITFPSSV
jgi:hypothetical protein